jgi:hypothetical protein
MKEDSLVNDFNCASLEQGNEAQSVLQSEDGILNRKFIFHVSYVEICRA